MRQCLAIALQAVFEAAQLPRIHNTWKIVSQASQVWCMYCVGWDPELLDRCALSSPYISSVEALQFSPKYRSHISSVRGRRLQYETAEAHKLKIYKVCSLPSVAVPTSSESAGHGIVQTHVNQCKWLAYPGSPLACSATLQGHVSQWICMHRSALPLQHLHLPSTCQQ